MTTGCVSCSRYEEGAGQFPFGLWFYKKIQYEAAKRGLEWGITPEFVTVLFVQQKATCALSGVPIKFGRIHLEEQTASLDRIDSKLGYVEGNVQWLHKDINRMKNAFDQDYFVEMCKAVATLL